MGKHLSITELAVILTTLILFVAALFFKGLTHDILLEAGVFLVSVKIILMNYKNMVSVKSILEELKEIKQELRDTNKSSN
ncbi:MAG: hypothetical protein JXB34_06245 [Bacteroidales bacterium]|nr:hypothetical protein [Bacteroidales bacterium]